MDALELSRHAGTLVEWLLQSGRERALAEMITNPELSRHTHCFNRAASARSRKYAVTITAKVPISGLHSGRERARAEMGVWTWPQYN